MTRNRPPRIVVVTGAESTGKSVLTRELATMFNAPFFPEYAREYLEKKNHPYTREEVLHIAREQVTQMTQALASGEAWYFFDTWLIITKVWMEVVYGEAPGFITRALESLPVDLYLLCAPDIPWIPDPLRENGGDRRIRLSEIYLRHIEESGTPYGIVTGTGAERTAHALQIIREKMGMAESV